MSDDCPYRYDDMQLVTYTPQECLDDPQLGCEDLIAYARFNKQSNA